MKRNKTPIEEPRVVAVGPSVAKRAENVEATGYAVKTTSPGVSQVPKSHWDSKGPSTRATCGEVSRLSHFEGELPSLLGEVCFHGNGNPTETPFPKRWDT